MQNSKDKQAETESIHSDRHTQIKLIASSEHSRRVFSFSGAECSSTRLLLHEPPASFTNSSTATLMGWQGYLRLSHSALQQISIQIYSYTSFFFNSVVFCGAVTQSLPLTFLPLLFSPASRRVSLSLSTALGIFLPLNFDSSPVSALSPAFSKTLFLPFCLFLCLLVCASLMISLFFPLDVSFCFLIHLTFYHCFLISLYLYLFPLHACMHIPISFNFLSLSLYCLLLICGISEPKLRDPWWHHHDIIRVIFFTFSKLAQLIRRLQLVLKSEPY